MTQILNNEEAVSYMLSSTGSIMMSVLENNTSFNLLTSEIKNRMKNNEHYSKFAILFNRAL